MPSAQLGGFQFRYIEGGNGEVVPSVFMRYASFTRPGYAGYGYQEDSRRGETLTLVGMAPFASATLRSAAMIQACALPEAGLCVMYTNDGEMWQHIKVVSVRCSEKNVACDTEGFNFYLYVTMEIQSAATSMG